MPCPFAALNAVQVLMIVPTLQSFNNVVPESEYNIANVQLPTAVASPYALGLLKKASTSSHVILTSAGQS